VKKGIILATILLSMLTFHVGAVQNGSCVYLPSIKVTSSTGAAQDESRVYLPLICARLTTFYVDATGGNDGNNGTAPEMAWQTLEKVSDEFRNGTFLPGDRILFKRGETWTIEDHDDRLEISGCSGEIGNHIYIGAYGTGDRPVFDADGNEVKVIVHRSWLEDADYITIADIEIVNGHNTSTVQLEAVHHWTIRNLYIHDFTSETKGAAVRVMSSSEDVLIEDCVITDIEGEGIYLGTSDFATDVTRRVTIRDCHISYCDNEAIDLKDATQSCFIYNNTLSMNGIGGGSHDPDQLTIGGRWHVVYQTTIEGTRGDNEVAIHIGRYGGGGFPDSGKYNRVERCLIKNGMGNEGAIRVNGENNEIINCTIVNCTNGIYGASNAGGGHIVKNNIFSGITNYPAHLTDGEYFYTFAHNCYSDGPSAVWYEDETSRDFSYVQSSLGQEAGGITDEADFAETVTYTLDEDSPCINAGDSSVTVYDWNDEYGASGAVDIGWREHGLLLPHRIFDTIFESASFARFTGYSGVSVAELPAPVEGPYSMRVNVTNTDSRYAYRTGLGNLKHFYADFHVNVDSLTMTTDDLFNIFEGRASDGDNLVVVQLYHNGVNTQIRGGVIEDDESWTYTEFFHLRPDWNLVEVFWMAAPEASYDEGALILWLNGAEKAHEDDLDNRDNTVDSFYVGAPSGLDTGTSGDLYVDAVRLDWVRRMNK
jgi:hypothetical protein